MADPAHSAHPYIPNSAPQIKAEMLQTIGVDDIQKLYASIPQNLRFTKKLALPPAIASEYELQKHINGILNRNITATETLSFLGAGSYQHIVPAVCDEINSRAEFLTAYAGEPYEDHGKWQALFEYTSLMANLLEMDVVNVPNYDGYQASATALRMAVRITGRDVVLVEETLLSDKRKKLFSYLDGVATIVTLPAANTTGRIDPDFLREKLRHNVAAVYLETPNAFGIIYPDIDTIANLAHDAGALLVCGTDPIALGFIESPAASGADILCGDIQSLGLGMHFGGAHGGFIASHDEEIFVYEFPSRLFGIVPTDAPGDIGFTDIAYERTSLAMRDDGVEWVGTAAALWAITAGVYLALMGPHGMRELGDTVAAHTRYAIEKLRVIPGIEVLSPDEPRWREIAVRYTHHSAKEVSAALHKQGIFGGAILKNDCNLSEVTLFAVTEIHTVADIDRLATALQEILR